MINYEIVDASKKLVLYIPGDILSTNVSEMSDRVLEIINNEASGDWQTLEVDMSRTKMVDSTGLNFLITLVKRLDNFRKKARAIITNANVKRTFVFTRLDQHIEVEFKG